MAKKTSTPIDREFDQFYKAYPIHRGKEDAEKAWRRLSAKDRRAARDGIARYCAICQQQGVSYKYPQGYLNGRRWEDEAENPNPTLPFMEGSDMHRSDATAAKGNYSPPSQGGATGRRDSGNGDGGGSLPDMALW